MKSNPREKWMLVCLPAILTAIVYSWGFARKNGVMLTAARTQLQEVSAQGNGKLNLTRKTQELTRLEDQFDAYAERKQAAVKARGDVSGSNRTVALKRLAAAADSSNLVLIQSSAITDSTAKQRQLAALSKGMEMPAPQLWRMELCGSYLDMLKMLEELKNADAFVVPVDVKMEPLKDETESPAMKWTLTVWI
jgi:hypothetical protein